MKSSFWTHSVVLRNCLSPRVPFPMERPFFSFFATICCAPRHIALGNKGNLEQSTNVCRRRTNTIVTNTLKKRVCEHSVVVDVDVVVVDVDIEEQKRKTKKVKC